MRQLPSSPDAGLVGDVDGLMRKSGGRGCAPSTLARKDVVVRDQDERARSFLLAAVAQLVEPQPFKLSGPGFESQRRHCYSYSARTSTVRGEGRAYNRLLAPMV